LSAKHHATHAVESADGKMTVAGGKAGRFRALTIAI